MKTQAIRISRQAAIHELKRRAARQNLSAFVTFTLKDYDMGWVHQEVCDALDKFLDDVHKKKSPRLIICMPPRSGKSELASRRFPGYALGRNPDLSIIACSYSADLASRFNRDVQRIIDSEEYKEVFPSTALSGRGGAFIRTSDLFEVVDHAGSYRSTGVGGGITGQGADILLIDDPVKDRAEADSATVRQSVWDWYTSTAYTRLSPGGGVIVMATRWHMDDLIGRLISASESGQGDKFKVINYAAIAEADETNRKTGEALHPSRYPLDRLLEIKRTIGSRDWEALYQQHPVPDGGATFRSEWLRRWNDKNTPPAWDTKVVSWDMTFKDTNTADFVVGQLWGVKGSSFYLLDQVRGRMDFVRTRQVFIEFARKHSDAVGKLVEDKANGSAIISSLQSAVTGLIPITPHESKEARASSVAPLFEAGNVFIPENRAEHPWVDGFVRELLEFPSSAHDDQVDACTQALNYLNKSSIAKWAKLGRQSEGAQGAFLTDF